MYLSSNFIVVQVKSCSGVNSSFKSVDKMPGLLFTEPYVITASAPLPVAIAFPLLFNVRAATSRYFV